MSEVHYHVESNTIPVQRRQLVECTRSVDGNVIPPRLISIPRNFDPHYNVPPQGGFGPLGRYHLGQWSEHDNESRLTMRPDSSSYVWPSPPSPPPPYFASFPHFSNENNVGPYYGVPPPPNGFVPLSRHYPGEWMDVEHLPFFAMRPEEELDWTPPPCLPPPIVFPINSGINVEESDEDIVLIQPNPNRVPIFNPKGLRGLPYGNHDVCTCHTISPTPVLYGPWIPDDSTDDEPSTTMHCCDCYVP